MGFLWLRSGYGLGGKPCLMENPHLHHHSGPSTFSVPFLSLTLLSFATLFPLALTHGALNSFTLLCAVTPLFLWVNSENEQTKPSNYLMVASLNVLLLSGVDSHCPLTCSTCLFHDESDVATPCYQANASVSASEQRAQHNIRQLGVMHCLALLQNNMTARAGGRIHLFNFVGAPFLLKHK